MGLHVRGGAGGFAWPLSMVLCAAGCGSHGFASTEGDAGVSRGVGSTNNSDASVSSGGSSSGDESSSSGGSSAVGFASDGGCSPDILHTGLVTTQNGLSVDLFDCPILQWAAVYKEPDPMIFKAIIYVESRFVDTSVACPNDPCGIPSGWTAAESGCFGLMQVVPACGGDPGDAGLLTNGQPNLTTDAGALDWATSIFNPQINVEIGIAGVASNRAQDRAKFPGCTEQQYTMMAVGDYNEYGSTKSCTEYNNAYDDGVVAAYMNYATAAGYPAQPYTP